MKANESRLPRNGTKSLMNGERLLNASPASQRSVGLGRRGSGKSKTARLISQSYWTGVEACSRSDRRGGECTIEPEEAVPIDSGLKFMADLPSRGKSTFQRRVAS